jgi:hypothetical protein
MFCTLKDKALNAPLWIHATATVVSFAAFQGTRIYLDHLYAASGHPVGFATGQLAFDGATIFGYYETMRAAGTFGTYVQTQMFDFAFIASVIIFWYLPWHVDRPYGRAAQSDICDGDRRCLLRVHGRQL